MSENPKPPPGYPTWLDFAAETMSSDYFILDVLPGTRTLTAINWAKMELAALRAERDGLRKACADWIKNDRAVCQERDDLHAERDKYRAALEKIAAYGTDGICPFGCDTPHIARDALRPEGKP